MSESTLTPIRHVEEFAFTLENFEHILLQLANGAKAVWAISNYGADVIKASNTTSDSIKIQPGATGYLLGTVIDMQQENHAANGYAIGTRFGL